MALSSTNIAAKASLLLQDATNVRWSPEEMVKWINSGCKELVLLKPTALTANLSMLLAAGTKQSLIGATFKLSETGQAPDPAISPIQLIEVVRNMGNNGTEARAGKAITGIERKILDVTLPDWHSSASSGVINHFMFDAKDPKTFYVYPKAYTTTPMYVEVVVSKAPLNITTLGADDLDTGIDEIYENVLVDYVLYRAYSKDSEFTANAQRSQWHYQAFQQALGTKIKNEIVISPYQQFQQPPAPQQQQG